MTKLTDYLNGENVSDKTVLAEGDEVLIGACSVKYIVVKIPKYDAFVLMRASGSDTSGLGLKKSPFTMGELRNYYGSKSVEFMNSVKIKPGFLVRGKASGAMYGVSFFCGTWKFINITTGSIVSSINVNACELGANDLRRLVKDTDLYEVAED